ncbi:Fic family protein [Hymenobacter humi]|uniref:Fic family protein n=1 Tax=Hymenobacter humi TaxID=1411620 RepID=A0ABW2UCY6_9BACT
MAPGAGAGRLAPADRRVEGVVAMLLDATQQATAPLTAERLFGWHAALFPTGYSGLYPLQVGAWRTGPMQVVSGPLGRERVHYEAPPAADLDAQMRQFLAWFNADQGLDPVLKAGLAHFWFVTLHPFDDGNGRIARAIADLQLARADGTGSAATACPRRSRPNARRITTCWKAASVGPWTSRRG